MHYLELKNCRNQELQPLQELRIGDLRLVEPHLFDAQTKGSGGPATIPTVPAHPERPHSVGAFVAEPERAILIGLLGRETDPEQPVKALVVPMREPSETEHCGRVCRLLVA